jgi:transposase-like protein
MKKYSGEEKAWLVEEREKNGKSKGAFAREPGLNVQTFMNRTRKVTGGQGRPIGRRRYARTAGFIVRKR